ncbi:MAG: hypothetical protein RQ826_07230 [Xanthomonadales bacterium]|nr:hypothetical protein [Xanthomonadales bacterium]
MRTLQNLDALHIHQMDVGLPPATILPVRGGDNDVVKVDAHRRGPRGLQSSQDDFFVSGALILEGKPGNRTRIVRKLPDTALFEFFLTDCLDGHGDVHDPHIAAFGRGDHHFFKYAFTRLFAAGLRSEAKRKADANNCRAHPKTV